VRRVTSITDTLGNTTSYTYDNLGRVFTITLPRPDPGFPEDFVITYNYDNFELVEGKELVCVTVEDTNGRITKYYYDEFDQLVRVVNAIERVTEFEYEKGKFKTITDTNLNTTTYDYDKLSRLETVHHPMGGTTSYTYYADSLLHTKTDRKGQTTTFIYNKLNRLTEKQYPGVAKILYNYTYGLLGSLEEQLANETTNFGYDSSYRMNSVSNPRGALSYAYTAADQIQTYQVNSDPLVTYGYYDDGSVRTITKSGDQIRYYCTLNGQKGQVLYPNNSQVDFSHDD
jgi:YD repeat-containing protein